MIGLALLAGACGSDGTTMTTPPPTTMTTAPPTTTSTTVPPPTSTTAPPSPTIEVGNGDFGPHLVDHDGMSLYLFLDDAQGSSTCYDDCAAAWPPLTNELTAGADVDAALLATSRRTDGSDQITYNGWPLYYYTGDQAPGDANGQGLGSAWFVVDPRGNPVGQAG